MGRACTPGWAGMLVLVAGCDLVFSVQAPPADARDTTTPRLFVPALFPERVPPGTGPYLFEGTGDGAMVHHPVPIVIDQLQAGFDAISVTIPPELADGVEICGLVRTTSGDLGITPPCVFQGTSAALMVAVPATSAVGAADTVSPLVISVRRGDVVFELPIAILPLDELEAVPYPTTGLFSRAAIQSPFTPSKKGPAIDWQVVSDVRLEHVIDVRGLAGASDATAACSSSIGGCAGGSSGPGNVTGDGASSAVCDAISANTRCSAPAPRGGTGGLRCNTGGSCVPTASAGGGGGGYAIAGSKGDETACPAGGSGLGGATDADAWLFSIADAGGGGGGAGATLVHSANTPPDYRGGGGGGGGGVFALDALGEVAIIGGSIDASGGAGGVGGVATCLTSTALTVGSGGAGAGGAIRLRARSVRTIVELKGVLVVAGGVSPGQPAGSGVGGTGRLRLDALGASSLDGLPGVVRGPEFDEPPAVVAADAVVITARSSSIDADVHWGVRAATATTYVLTTTPAAGAVSLTFPLAPGLNELCVFATAPLTADVTGIAPAAKRCTWVARVDSL